MNRLHQWQTAMDSMTKDPDEMEIEEIKEPTPPPKKGKKGDKKGKGKTCVFKFVVVKITASLSCGFTDGKKSADKKGKKAPEVLDEDAPPPPPAPLEVHMSIK